MQLKANGFPRRSDLTLLSPIERAIWDAKQLVESGPAHPLMTDATILLSQAQDKVADYVESLPLNGATGPKVVLLSDLDQSRFFEENGIGGPPSCVKIFDCYEDALKFAAAMIRQHANQLDSRSDWSDEEVLEAFQDGLGGMEYFHIRTVVA